MKKFIVLISMILCVNQIKSSEILAGLKSVLFTYPKVTAAVLIGAAAFDSLNSYRLVQDIGRRNEALIFKQQQLNKLKEKDPNYKETHDFDFNNMRWHFLRGNLYRGHFNDPRNTLINPFDKETENQLLNTEDHYLALACSVYFVGFSCFYALKLLSY